MKEKEHDESYYAFKPIDDNPIVLDFTGCRYLGEIHRILKKRFGFPEYYGENWSALWDCIRDLFNERGEWSVEIYGFRALQKDLREECAKMLEVFDDVHAETPNVVFRLIS
jgi:RNAse (barnase) inhibitor barstar